MCLAAAVAGLLLAAPAANAAGQIRISEWMYNTAADNPGEWVELTNVGDAPVDMAGYSYDDDSRTPGVFSLAGLGVVAPGESVVFTELNPAAFRTDWSLCAAVKVVGPYSNNLGRADEINIFDGQTLVDRLTYGDQTIGGPRTNGVSAWAPPAALGVNDPRLWVRSTVGDAEGSHTATSGSIGSPGKSTLGSGDPCVGRIRITEWMYNTLADTPGEWVELTNVGGAPVNMANYSFDDDSRLPGVFSLAGFGTVQPGETVVFTEIQPAAFRTDWGLCPQAKVIGPYTNNLGRADEINIFDGQTLVDRLTYGDQAFPGTIRTNGTSGWVTAAGLGQNNIFAWVRSTVGDAEGSRTATSGSVGSPGKSTHGGVDPCTGGAPQITSSQPIIAGTVGDPTNPGLTLTLPPEIENLPVTASSSNPGVLPVSGIAITGSGEQRTVAFTPTGRGTASVTFTAGSASTTVSYAASNAAPGRYYYGISDASAALSVGDGYVLLLNDETNTIFLHREGESGYPVKTWTFTAQELGTGSEIDFEGIARSGDLLILTGSHGNNREGEVRTERRTFVTATITGSGAATEIAFRSRHNNLWADLRAWDQSNGHGLGANALGFVAGSAPGVLPNPPSGFNVEGLEFAPDGETIYLGFRAPTVGGRAVVVPVSSISPAQFGAPILLDLDGRSIRALRRNAANEYLISAGPSPQNNTWALYTWDGAGAPRFNRALPDEDLLTGGSWESIAAVPLGLAGDVRLVADSGDTNFYGTGATKDLATGYQKSYTDVFTLAAPATSVSTPGEVTGFVPPQLGLTVGGPAVFAPFIAGIAQTYAAETTVKVVSTAGDATLSVSDPSTTATGHLVNGTFALPAPLTVRAGSAAFAPLPATLLSYAAPVSNDVVTVAFQQAIGETDALRTGAYGKTLTFTLSTTAP